MIRLEFIPVAKHRRPVPAVTHGWTTWPRHRDDTAGAAASDGMEEYARKWVAAMQIRQAQIYRQRMAVMN